MYIENYVTTFSNQRCGSIWSQSPNPRLCTAPWLVYYLLEQTPFKCLRLKAVKKLHSYSFRLGAVKNYKQIITKIFDLSPG